MPLQIHESNIIWRDHTLLLNQHWLRTTTTWQFQMYLLAVLWQVRCDWGEDAMNFTLTGLVMHTYIGELSRYLNSGFLAVYSAPSSCQNQLLHRE